MFKALKNVFKKPSAGQSQTQRHPAQSRHVAQRTRPATAAAGQKRASSALPDSYLDMDSMFK